MTDVVIHYVGSRRVKGESMEEQSKRGQVINRLNVSVGDIVLFRGKRYEVEEICHPGVWLKSDRKGDIREFIYFYEAEKFHVMFA